MCDTLPATTERWPADFAKFYKNPEERSQIQAEHNFFKIQGLPRLSGATMHHDNVHLVHTDCEAGRLFHSSTRESRFKTIVALSCAYHGRSKETYNTLSRTGIVFVSIPLPCCTREPSRDYFYAITRSYNINTVFTISSETTRYSSSADSSKYHICRFDRRRSSSSKNHEGKTSKLRCETQPGRR